MPQIQSRRAPHTLACLYLVFGNAACPAHATQVFVSWRFNTSFCTSPKAASSAMRPLVQSLDKVCSARNSSGIPNPILTAPPRPPQTHTPSSLRRPHYCGPQYYDHHSGRNATLPEGMQPAAERRACGAEFHENSRGGALAMTDQEEFYSKCRGNEWTHVHIVRDPLERWLSGYLDKCHLFKVSCAFPTLSPHQCDWNHILTLQHPWRRPRTHSNLMCHSSPASCPT